jgi:uncharacterized protein YgiB involved in biofilm formation
MSESIGNEHGLLCPNCKKGDQLQVVVSVWADLTHQGTSIDANDEWDNSSLARCACGWNGIVNEFIELPPGEGKMFSCADCDSEFYENQCDDVENPQERFLPGDTWTDKQCPSCGALCFPL